MRGSRHSCGLEKLSLEAASIVSLPNRFLMLSCPGTESGALKAKRALGAHMLLLTQHSYYFYFAITQCWHSLAAIQLEEGMHRQTKSLPQMVHVFTLLLQAAVMDDVIG